MDWRGMWGNSEEGGADYILSGRNVVMILRRVEKSGFTVCISLQLWRFAFVALALDNTSNNMT